MVVCRRLDHSWIASSPLSVESQAWLVSFHLDPKVNADWPDAVAHGGKRLSYTGPMWIHLYVREAFTLHGIQSCMGQRCCNSTLPLPYTLFRRIGGHLLLRLHSLVDHKRRMPFDRPIFTLRRPHGRVERGGMLCFCTYPRHPAPGEETGREG